MSTIAARRGDLPGATRLIETASDAARRRGRDVAIYTVESSRATIGVFGARAGRGDGTDTSSSIGGFER